MAKGLILLSARLLEISSLPYDYRRRKPNPIVLHRSQYRFRLFGCIQNRVRHGGADVPTDTVIQRFNTRRDTLLKVLPQCNSVELFDNDNGFIKVAEYQKGHIHATEDKCKRYN